MYTRERGLQRADDEVISALARAETRVVVTQDSDTPQLVALSGDRTPSIIHLRVGPQTPGALRDLALGIVSTVEDRLDAGVIVSVACVTG